MGETPMLRRSHLLLLALIVALAALLRFSNLSSLGFWSDELCSLSDADGHGLRLTFAPLNRIAPQGPSDTKLSAADSFWQIPIAVARDDAHPPLYFMLLRLWQDMWGDTETAVRSLSVVCSLLAIVLLYVAARDTVGSLSALAACALMAVATPQIQYAQEARDYMPVLPIALTAFVAMNRLARTGRRGWAVILFLCVLAMMFTHYFAAGIAAGLFVYAALAFSQRVRVYALAAISIAGILFAVIWGPVVLHQRVVTRTVLLWMNDEAPGHLQRRLIDLCQLPVRFFAEPAEQTGVVTAIGALMLGGAAYLFHKRLELRPWLAWLACSIGLVAGMDLARSTSQLHWVRYSLFATPAAYVILAATIHGRWRFALPLLAVIASVLCLPGAYRPSWKIDFREMVMAYQHGKGPEDALIICGEHPPIDGTLLEAFRRYAGPLPTVTAVLTEPPRDDMLDQLRRCRSVWIAWLGNDRQMPGFMVEQQIEWPALTLQQGHFVSPTSRLLVSPR